MTSSHVQESLLDQALSLSASARRLASGADDRLQEQRTATAVLALQQALDNLVSTRSTFEAAKSLGVGVQAQPDWGSGLGSLEAHVGRGLPSPQAIQAAKAKVIATTKAARQEIDNLWPEWIEARLQEIPLSRLASLPREERELAKTRLRELPRKSAPQNVTDIRLVQLKLEALKAQFPSESDLSEALESALAAITTEKATLASLTGEQLAALRGHPEVAEQVTLRYRHSK